MTARDGKLSENYSLAGIGTDIVILWWKLVTFSWFNVTALFHVVVLVVLHRQTNVNLHVLYDCWGQIQFMMHTEYDVIRVLYWIIIIMGNGFVTGKPLQEIKKIIGTWIYLIDRIVVKRETSSKKHGRN